jgi:chromosomal replication initiator protein
MIKDHILVWNNCLTIIRKSIEAQPFKTWFEPIKPVKLTEEVLTIQVPNKFFYEWLEEHYVDVLKKAVKKELGLKGSLEYQIMVENHRLIGTAADVSKRPAKSEAAEEQKILNPL